jgi:hypothetical protein
MIISNTGRVLSTADASRVSPSLTTNAQPASPLLSSTGGSPRALEPQQSIAPATRLPVCPERIAEVTAAPIELLRTILKYGPKDYIPVATAFGSVSLGLVGPATRFEAMYDPLRALLSDPYIAGYHVDSDTESGGSITSALATTAGVISQARVARMKFDTDPDQAGADEALVTVTWAPEDLNAHGVALEMTTTGLGPAVTDANMTARFTLPSGQTGGVWWHFARRVSSLPKCVPSRAFLSTPIASGEGMTATASFATTGLTSGNLMKQTVSAISPASPYFVDYAEFMLRNFYERL